MVKVLSNRVFFCFNLLLLTIVTATCLAQAQPGDGAAANSPSKTDAVPPTQRVVLKVGDLQITQAAFEQYLADLESTEGPADMSRKKIGDNYASMLMLSKMAAEQHLDQSPQVQRLIDIDRMQVMSNAEFTKLKSESKTTPEEIRAYYDSHLEDYDVIRMRRVFIWPGVIESGAKGAQGLTVQQATALADAVRQVYKSHGDFSRIQKLINDTPHGKDGVNVDPEPLSFQRGELPGRYNDLVFRLQEGEWTELHDAPGAYVFLQVVSRSRRELKEVTPQIELSLEAKKLKEQLQSLKKKTGVWMDETYFASKSPGPASNAEPGAPGQAKNNSERGEKDER